MHKELPMQHEYLVYTDFTQFESFEMYQLGSRIVIKKFIYQICLQYSSKDFIICSNFLWTPEISFYWDKAETFDVKQDNVLDSFWVLKYLQGRKSSSCLCRQFSISLNMFEIHLFWKKMIDICNKIQFKTDS